MDDFFFPRSIAVIGASRESGKVGYSVLKNLMDANYDGELVPVNPNADEVLGLKAYPKVKKVDLAIIVVPASIVPSVLELYPRDLESPDHKARSWKRKFGR
jgi:acyl-CoA synthetase (NDP forming)